MDIFKNPLLNGWLTLLGSIIGVLGAYLIMRIQIKETYIYGSVKNLPSKINKLKIQYDSLKSSIFGLGSTIDNDLTKIEKIDENKIKSVENIISNINNIELPNTKNFNEISGNIDIIQMSLMMIKNNESDVRDLSLDKKIEVIRRSFKKMIKS